MHSDAVVVAGPKRCRYIGMKLILAIAKQLNYLKTRTYLISEYKIHHHHNNNNTIRSLPLISISEMTMESSQPVERYMSQGVRNSSTKEEKLLHG